MDKHRKKKFIDLTPEELLGLDTPIFKNGRQLYRNSVLIANTENSYGCANSLLILASEEMIKAILVLLQSKGYNVFGLKNSKKFFFDHKIRHQIAQLIEMGLGIFETSEQWSEKSKNKKYNYSNERFNWLMNGLDQISSTLSLAGATGDRIDRLTYFNDQKNAGLYVGYHGYLKEPSIFDKSVYEGNKIIFLRIQRFYKTIKIILNPKALTRFPKQDIDSLRRSLKVLIEDALVDFELK